MSVLGKLRAAGRRNTAIFAKCWRPNVEPAAHQYDMAARVDGPSQYQADFWPRDHGKSEIFCISYPLRRICEDPNIRILIVQKTATEAAKTLGVIKQELESNQPLKAYYTPHWQQTVGHRDISNQIGQVEIAGQREGAWQQQRIYCKRTRRGKDPTVEAVGVLGAITGGHFDLIILDDVEDDENTRTDDRLKMLIEWLTGTIMQLREPHTKIIIVGTLKTNKPDIYNTVLESPVWDTHLTGAILSHALEEIEYEPLFVDRDGTPLLSGVKVKTPNVRTLWPQKWSIEELLFEMLASLDRAVWIREKLNDLRALAGKIFKREEFRYFNDDDLAAIKAWGSFERIVQVWDTSYGESAASDWSVCVTAGLFKGSVYILDVYRARLTTPQLKQAVKSQYDLWQPEYVGIEDVGSGKSVIQVLEQEAGVPLKRISPQGKDKPARARSVTVFVNAGRILFQQGAAWVQALLNELTMFPDDKFDDQVDALVYAVLELLVANEGQTVRVVSRRRR
jgi:predicted phage terminase large subunit-like protein